MRALCFALALAFVGATAPAERELAFSSADGSVLKGTLSWPAALNDGQRVPLFILIAGSGMQDRDETVGPNKPFAELAQGLNGAGFAVLRYDKRGVGGSTSAISLLTVTRQSYLDDVLAAIKAGAADSHVDRSQIYLAGHSEGGELAMGAALQEAPIRGIVMLSALPIPYAAMIEKQVERQHLTAQQLAVMQQVLKTNHVFLDSYAKIDPRIEIARIDQPMLVLHGSQDIQVSDDDIASLIAAARTSHEPFTYQELDGDNHLFAKLPPSTRSTGAEYMESHPLDPRVWNTIAAWFAKTNGTPR